MAARVPTPCSRSRRRLSLDGLKILVAGLPEQERRLTGIVLGAYVFVFGAVAAVVVDLELSLSFSDKFRPPAPSRNGPNVSRFHEPVSRHIDHGLHPLVAAEHQQAGRARVQAGASSCEQEW